MFHSPLRVPNDGQKKAPAMRGFFNIGYATEGKGGIVCKQTLLSDNVKGAQMHTSSRQIVGHYTESGFRGKRKSSAK
ncbi:hypothetical protein [Pantoea sp. B65]|uniref:hypothetical protein n=1 Tax=Pantoea sp. B65 TaxID=2813359 RepID=UPI0039B41F1D